MKKILITLLFLLFFGFLSALSKEKNTLVLGITPPTAVNNSTPSANPSEEIATASSLPATSSAEEEKVKEIREAIKEKLTQIKEKIEKKAYVGQILELTDSSLTLTNFRGKRRVRITNETVIVLANKKEGTTKDLAVEDKIIAMGEVDSTETLQAKRIVVVSPPKNPPPERISTIGQIASINQNNSTIVLQNNTGNISLKITQDTNLIDPVNPGSNLSLKNLSENQKIIAVYLKPNSEKTTPSAKTIFFIK